MLISAEFVFSKQEELVKYLSTFSKLGPALSFFFFVYNCLMEFLNELWNNQPNTVIGIGLAMLVMLVIYIKLLDIYK